MLGVLHAYLCKGGIVPRVFDGVVAVSSRKTKLQGSDNAFHSLGLHANIYCLPGSPREFTRDECTLFMELSPASIPNYNDYNISPSQ